MANEKNPARLIWADDSFYSPLSGARPIRFLKFGGVSGFTETDYFAYEHSDYSLGYDEGIAFDGSQFVYMSQSRIRTNVCKLNIENMKWTYYDLGVDHGSASALAIGGGYLWLGTWVAHLYKCDLTDPTIKTEIVLSGYKEFTYIAALEWDGSYLWVASEMWDGANYSYEILRIHPVTLAFDVVWSDPTDSDWCMDLHYAFNYIWAVFDTSPLYILRIDPTTLAYDTLTGAADENECYSITSIAAGEAPGLVDDYIFVATCDWDVTEIRVLRINPYTLTYDRREITGYYNGYGATKGGGYIWFSVYQDPGAYIKVNPVTLDYDVYVTADVNAYRIATLDLKNLKWQIALDALPTNDRVGTSCASYDGKTYVASVYTSGGAKYIRVWCIKADGEIIWTTTLPFTSDQTARAYVSTPVVSYNGERVYIVVSWYYAAGPLGSNWSDAIALKVLDGSVVWQKASPEGIKYDAAWYSRTNMSQPAIGKDEYVYAVLYSNVYKLKPDDGTTIWTKSSVVSQCAPALSPDGNRVYVHSDDTVYAYDTDGNLKWQVTTDLDPIYGITVEYTKILVTGRRSTSVGLYAYDVNGNLLFTKDFDARRCAASTIILPPDTPPPIIPGNYIYVQDGTYWRVLNNLSPYEQIHELDVNASDGYSCAINPCHVGTYYPDDIFIIFPYCGDNKIRWAKFHTPTDILALGRDERLSDIHNAVAVCKTGSYTSDIIFTTKIFIYRYSIAAEPFYTFQSYFASYHGSDITNRVNSDGSSPPALKTLTVYVKDDADAPISTAHVIVNGNEGDTDSDGMVQFSLTTGVTVTATASKTAWGGYEGLESEEVTMDTDKTITLRLAASSIKKLPIDITGPGDITWL